MNLPSNLVIEFEGATHYMWARKGALVLLQLATVAGIKYDGANLDAIGRRCAEYSAKHPATLIKGPPLPAVAVIGMPAIPPFWCFVSQLKPVVLEIFGEAAANQLQTPATVAFLAKLDRSAKNMYAAEMVREMERLATELNKQPKMRKIAETCHPELAPFFAAMEKSSATRATGVEDAISKVESVDLTEEEPAEAAVAKRKRITAEAAPISKQ